MSQGDGHFSVSGTKIEGVGYTKQNVLFFRSAWPCVYPSFYGSAPPVSTRITALRVLTSFVPPVHNQGAGLAPLQGLALWKIFLPATGSFFVISLTDLYVFHGWHLAVDVFPTSFPYLPAFPSPLDSASGNICQRLSPTVTEHCLFFLIRYAACICGLLMSLSSFFGSYSTPFVRIV